MKQSKSFKGRRMLGGFPRFLQDPSDPAQKSIDVAPMPCQLRPEVDKGFDFGEYFLFRRSLNVGRVTTLTGRQGGDISASVRCWEGKKAEGCRSASNLRSHVRDNLGKDAHPLTAVARSARDRLCSNTCVRLMLVSTACDVCDHAMQGM